MGECGWAIHIKCPYQGLPNLRYAYTLNSIYNEKKYAEILLRYKWLFVKGDVFIGEWGIFGVEVFLC